MIIGVPKEIKNHEYRVGLTPDSVNELHKQGHTIWVEKSAGAGIGFSDQDYISAGAKVAAKAADIFEQADMIIKVKEPQAIERKLLRKNQLLFTYLHLAPDPEQTTDLIQSEAICIAYETVTDNQGGLPLLAPMSEVAGRMSIQAGAQALEKSNAGKGLLLGGVPGVEPAKVVIIGAGVVGRNALQMAVGLGADVTIIDKNMQALRAVDMQYANRVKTIYSTQTNIEKYCLIADLVIGAVLIPGAAAPKLVSEDLIKRMQPGSAVVDVAIDQGGCFATSKPTTHSDPMFILHNIVHYCVANMPGAVAKTATIALNNATLPYILTLAEQGYKKALRDNVHLRNGLNIYRGVVTNQNVAQALNLNYVDSIQALNVAPD